MADFSDMVKNELNTKETLNGDLQFGTTLNACLDLFATGAALRNDKDRFAELFKAALNEDAETAVKILFYIRDVRGGQGERDLFRVGLKILGQESKYLTDGIFNAIKKIPEYGRWDDLYTLLPYNVDEKIGDFARNMVRDQWQKDINSEQPSIMAKWLKSVNTSSKESRNLGKLTCGILRMNERKYRHNLAALRKKINIVETNLTKKDYEKIDFEKVPSKAMFKYKKVFNLKVPGYQQYLEDVKNGNKKINASTLYPYDIVHYVSELNYTPVDKFGIKQLNLQWENLPNYVTSENAICVVDTSGSMQTCANPNPMEVAVSLGIYIAERNLHPVWKDKFITFSTNPTFQTIKGNDIGEKVRNVWNAAWSGSTNIEKVFMLLLNAAVNNNLPKEDFIKKLYIISDMQFNEATSLSDKAKLSVFKTVKMAYQNAGYDFPEVVFWNVSALGETFPVTKDETGTYLVSGSSPVIMKHLQNLDSLSPISLMHTVLNSERYSKLMEAE